MQRAHSCLYTSVSTTPLHRILDLKRLSPCCDKFGNIQYAATASPMVEVAGKWQFFMDLVVLDKQRDKQS